MRASDKGRVYLVGAGPGDPELITVKGLRCLRAAEVIVFDRLVSPVLLGEVPARAERVFVGKESGCHTMAQEEISALLIARARLGRTVVRLKGGDPFLFGRGGEEAEALAEAGIPFEVVPGVSSALAVPAYAGIPLTHRNYAASVTIVTGHERSTDRSVSSVNWEALARGEGTLVILMGLAHLAEIADRLIAFGMPPDTPAAVIEQGTLPAQRTVTGKLERIADQVREEGVCSPAIIVIGAVEALQESIAWFEPYSQIPLQEARRTPQERFDPGLGFPVMWAASASER